MLEAEIQSYKDRILETSGVNPKKCMVCGRRMDMARAYLAQSTEHTQKCARSARMQKGRREECSDDALGR